MADYSKKRRASVSDVSGDSDNDASHKTVKKSKRSNAAISPAGKDDEGNPFWEVSQASRAFRSDLLTVPSALEKTTGRRLNFQELMLDQHS